jgi:ribose 1,5-bisphosphokinase
MVPQTGLRGGGVLIPVVGPSGAGKDALIAAARRFYGAGRGVVFPQRVVTRSADAGIEPHASVSAAEFGRLKAAGAFVASWQAHGNDYGVPLVAVEEVAAGRVVVVNVSRSVIGELRGSFRRTHVVYVTAAADVLTHRLKARGRESDAEIARRVARAGDHVPPSPPVTVIDNSGALADAVETFLSVIDAYVPARSREVRDALD